MIDTITLHDFTLAVYRKGDEHAEKLAIVIPGRLDTKDYAHIKSLVDFLSTHGYFAIAFDPPGTWESPGGMSLFTTTNYLKAVEELIKLYGNRPTFLIGHSRGGSVSMLAGPEVPELLGIGLIMANYGAPTAPEEADKKVGYHVSHRPNPFDYTQEVEFRIPMSYFLDGQKYDPLASLKTIEQPKFIAYSTNDKFTEASFVKDLYKDLPGKKHLYALDCTHDYFALPETITQVNTCLEKFLNEMSLD